MREGGGRGIDEGKDKNERGGPFCSIDLGILWGGQGERKGHKEDGENRSREIFCMHYMHIHIEI